MNGFAAARQCRERNEGFASRRVSVTTLVAFGALGTACQNNDVPENEPTLVTATGDDDGSNTDGSADDGLDETADTGPPAPMCWPDHDPADAALFQCVGRGVGDLHWEQYALSWSAASLQDPVTIEFPPHERNAPNVQACCEADATTPALRVGCLEDCARAACNLAIERLRTKLSEPPALCGGDCLERFEQTLTTWIDALEANYDDCLQVARGEAEALNLPDPARASDPVPTGAGRTGVLTIDCAIDAQAMPHDTEQTCETGLNAPTGAVWEDWSCPSLEGGAEIDGPAGTQWVPLAGSVRFRRGLCAADPCWLSLEGLELEAASVSEGRYPSDATTASLAYQGFGRYDTTTGDGTIAAGMLGLEVTLESPPGAKAASRESRSFMMGNSEPALVELDAGRFRIGEAWFGWGDRGVTITVDAAQCVRTAIDDDVGGRGSVTDALLPR